MNSDWSELPTVVLYTIIKFLHDVEAAMRLRFVCMNYARNIQIPRGIPHGFVFCGRDELFFTYEFPFNMIYNFLNQGIHWNNFTWVMRMCGVCLDDVRNKMCIPLSYARNFNALYGSEWINKNIIFCTDAKYDISFIPEETKKTVYPYLFLFHCLEHSFEKALELSDKYIETFRPGDLCVIFEKSGQLFDEEAIQWLDKQDKLTLRLVYSLPLDCNAWKYVVHKFGAENIEMFLHIKYTKKGYDIFIPYERFILRGQISKVEQCFKHRWSRIKLSEESLYVECEMLGDAYGCGNKYLQSQMMIGNIKYDPDLCTDFELDELFVYVNSADAAANLETMFNVTREQVIEMLLHIDTEVCVDAVIFLMKHYGITVDDGIMFEEMEFMFLKEKKAVEFFMFLKNVGYTLLTFEHVMDSYLLKFQDLEVGYAFTTVFGKIPPKIEYSEYFVTKLFDVASNDFDYLNHFIFWDRRFEFSDEHFKTKCIPWRSEAYRLYYIQYACRKKNSSIPYCDLYLERFKRVAWRWLT